LSKGLLEKKEGKGVRLNDSSILNSKLAPDLERREAKKGNRKKVRDGNMFFEIIKSPQETQRSQRKKRIKDTDTILG